MSSLLVAGQCERVAMAIAQWVALAAQPHSERVARHTLHALASPGFGLFTFRHEYMTFLLIRTPVLPCRLSPRCQIYRHKKRASRFRIMRFPVMHKCDNAASKVGQGFFAIVSECKSHENDALHNR